MTTVIAFEYVFPLIGCRRIKGSHDFAFETIHGTAFYLKNNIFITAGHAIQNALEHEVIGLGYVRNSSVKFAKVSSHEIIADFDIGVVKAEVPEAKALNWNFDASSMLDHVQTAGYSYPLDLQEGIIPIRAFKGYIVSDLRLFRLQSKPRCYELSFNCPRGLSGAPLFTEETNPRVKGVVIGNKSTEMLIYSDKEIIEEGKGKETFERYEATQFGMAIQTGSIKHVESTVLGASVEDYVRSVKLV